MLGVSDYFRIGSLRIEKNCEFVSATNDIPKLTHISELCISSQRIERGESLDSDIKNLLAPSGSLGGARPKASVLKGDELYIVKFPSIKDEYKQISRSEKTMLDVARIAKITVCESELFDTVKGTALLVKRFDRNGDKRIPYKSAMTLLGVRDGDESNDKSYCDLANMLDDKNKKELFRRMVFNGLFGNTDDHLRNHGVLYDEKTKTWNLSPAFDITPTPIAYSKQNHALNFIDFESLPSLELFDKIKSKFDITTDMFKEILSDMLNARDKFDDNLIIDFLEHLKLIDEIPLPAIYKNHSLKGDYKSFFDCHLKPDYIAIYRKGDSYIELARIGSHSHLFKKY